MNWIHQLTPEQKQAAKDYHKALAAEDKAYRLAKDDTGDGCGADQADDTNEADEGEEDQGEEDQVTSVPVVAADGSTDGTELHYWPEKCVA